MLGGIRELLPRRRAVMLLAAPVVLGVCGSVGTALALPTHPALGSHDTAAHRVAAPVTAGGSITPQYLRSLPHDGHASIGVPRFRQRPPRVADAHSLAAAAIPGIAIEAYRHAAAVLATSDPACHLAWYDLAGIGRVESDNGLTWGSLARVSANGTLSPPILGPVLDGSNGTPAYPTTDHGRLEHGGKWERAVGPMQFLPTTWAEYAQDGNGDGVKDPQNYWDAALTTGVFLCANGGNLATGSGFARAIYAYNHSAEYVALVRAWARFYGRAGASQLTASPSVLPVGYASTPAAHHGRHAPSTTAGPSPEAVVLHAVAVTEAAHTYSFSFELLSGGGSAVALGNGRADLVTRDAVASLDMPGVGLSTVCDIETSSGLTVYVQLPPSLDRELGEPANAWLAVTSSLRQARQVANVMGEVVFAASWMRSSVAALGGATSAENVVARNAVVGVPTTAYGGPLTLSAGAAHDPSAAYDLGQIEQLTGTDSLSATAWIDHAGLLRQASFAAPRVTGISSGPITLVVRYGGFGAAISLPTVRPSQYPPPTTTSSTTSTTSSTTTTTTTPTTTSSSTTTSSPSSTAPSTTSAG